MRLLGIQPSERKDKKLVAVFGLDTGRTKTVHFGAKGASDFTLNKDPERKERYLNRHSKRENWENPLTAGALSRWILWNKTTLKGSIADFKKRFNL